jgi:hypothetical protein
METPGNSGACTAWKLAATASLHCIFSPEHHNLHAAAAAQKGVENNPHTLEFACCTPTAINCTAPFTQQHNDHKLLQHQPALTLTLCVVILSCTKALALSLGILLDGRKSRRRVCMHWNCCCVIARREQAFGVGHSAKKV